MSKNPFVSVVIPSLNEEKYIESTLKSVKNQDYKGKYEIIVADGMSKDKTVKIAKKYADKIIAVKRKGVSAGRNEGAKVAKGDILFFLDADTILLPNVITELVKCLKKTDVMGVSIPFLLDDLKKNILMVSAMGVYSLLTKIKLQPVYTICFACKKKSFLKIGGFDEKLHVAEDIEFGQRLKKLGKLDYIDTTFVIASSRRLKKWNWAQQTKAWPLGYFSIKLFNKQPKYPAFR